ncbi:cAMP-dependent protein kinase type II regulatory subunit [Hypsibius exemplaris]|uniref:cAMP-dependent protein kinase type II regulatory subunit n=1 Tax=Hypsibius exemplaris TaxID=2072580 RepID=A0A1W0W8W3_HYPEX|nr:cAMP-dependent protein kinase type II regulatory subunit [Hypsibius exemplaris]
MSNLNVGGKSATGKAARRLPDGAKEILQDFVVSVLRQKLLDDEDKKDPVSTSTANLTRDASNINIEPQKGLETQIGNIQPSSVRDFTAAQDRAFPSVNIQPSGHFATSVPVVGAASSVQPAGDEALAKTDHADEHRYDPTASPPADQAAKSFPKTEEQMAHVKEAVNDVLLFRMLDDEHMFKVIEALEQVNVTAGQDVIEFGDEKADYFYVIESGEFDCYAPDGQSGMKKIHEYINKGSFGELALMYAQPRAATVTARTDGQLWQLDRETFKRIIVQGAYEKRKLYMSLLEKVDFIADLQNYEKQSVCDALTGKVYNKGEVVMSQGDAADGMYFVEAGGVVCLRHDEGSEDKEIGKAVPGEYVGELALITNKPRAATVIVSEDNTKLAFLDAKAFERLMGPCVDILNKNVSRYKDRMIEAFGENYAQFLS